MGIENTRWIRLAAIAGLTICASQAGSGGAGPATPGPGRGALEAFSDSIESLVRKASPAVVQIVSDSFVAHDDSERGAIRTVTKEMGVGTGFVVSPDGDVMTNAHVVAGASRVRVRLHERASSGQPARGELVDAHVIGVDRDTDLALLKIPGAWPHLSLGDSRHLRQGQIVLALGSPRGLENSVSMGVVSAVNRQIHPDSALAFIQTDAPINPGNSGGPLIDASGAVVGINTFIFSDSGGSEGVGFAIPSNLVSDIYGQLRKYGAVRRGELGVIVRTVTPGIAAALGLSREEGVLVQDVKPGGGAAEAGLACNDIVTRVQGRPVRNLRQFSASLFRTGIGDRIPLEVVRGGKTIHLEARLEEPADHEQDAVNRLKDRAVAVPELGVLAIPLDANSAELFPNPRYPSGSIVVAKLDTAASFQEQLEPGDIVYGVNGKTAPGIEPLKSLLSAVPDTSPLVVQIERDGVLRYLVLHDE